MGVGLHWLCSWLYIARFALVTTDSGAVTLGAISLA